ncbi:hypothetical protein CFC21_097856 [Triticum aestivum]|uniref:Uncharacterized protein n=3 Tax=Triticum TaxID=4564 RepID=A0A9R0ZBX9_TRITD|nr:hypothetical protein CFC21_097856 [Triticum aestivum]VAI75073.1 unnamed protein product [Triticum turgidum subsp. durum]
MATLAGSSTYGEDEEHTPTRAKGTTNEPFDGGAFTLEVLAHAGKGVNGGAASGNRRRSREGEQRSLSCAGALVDRKKRGKGNGSRGAVALAAVHGGRSGPQGRCPFFLDRDGADGTEEEKEEGKQERKRQRRS